MALRVLAVLTSRGAAAVVAPRRTVVGLGRAYVNRAQGAAGLSSTRGQPQRAAGKSPTGISTQIEAFGQQLRDNQSFLDFLKTTFIDFCYAKTEEREHQEPGPGTETFALSSNVVCLYLLPSRFPLLICLSMVYYSLALGVESMHALPNVRSSFWLTMK